MSEDIEPNKAVDEVVAAKETGDASETVKPFEQVQDAGEEGKDVAVAKAGEASGEAPDGAATSTDSGDFDTRYLNDKWYGRYKTSGVFMEHKDGDWVELDEDGLELIQQLWYEQEAAEHTVVDGVRMKWNATKQEWEPEGDDEDFIAQYQASYGVEYDYSKMDEERKANEPPKPVVEEKKKKKRGIPEPTEPLGWVDMDEKVNAVYVSNLPSDITLEEFTAFMTKCGVIQPDARTNKPKIKLYTDENGQLKGDGRCCYIRKESVELALSILDGFRLKDKDVKVEKAHFELKGEFDPSKKRRKMTAAQKKTYMDRQKRVFEWKPEKPRNYRPLSDCTVIIKNLFTLEMMAKNAALMLDLKEEVEKSCMKFGTVKKVVVYDSNPEGVVSVNFETTEQSDMAVKMLNGQLVDGRKLTCHLWDGRTKYKVEETEEERAKRLAEWDKFVGGDEEEDGVSSSDQQQQQPEAAPEVEST